MNSTLEVPFFLSIGSRKDYSDVDIYDWLHELCPSSFVKLYLLSVCLPVQLLLTFYFSY